MTYGNDVQRDVLDNITANPSHVRDYVRIWCFGDRIQTVTTLKEVFLQNDMQKIVVDIKDEMQELCGSPITLTPPVTTTTEPRIDCYGDVIFLMDTSRYLDGRYREVSEEGVDSLFALFSLRWLKW